MSFISIRKKLMFMMGTICALFGIALAFILFFAIDQSRQAEALQKEISPCNTIKRARGCLPSTALCFKRVFITARSS